MVDQTTYKNALRKLTGGVSVVTIMDGNRRHGFTLSSFMNISISPATIAISVDRKHTAHSLLMQEGKFGLNILAKGQEDISNTFAFVKDADRFTYGNWINGQRGLPVLNNALVWFDCDIVNSIDVHSHTIFIGEVMEIGEGQENQSPLLYGQGKYHSI